MFDKQSGLPHSTTTALAQDTAGFIWIGTRGGLARFDGQRFQVFKQTNDKKGSLTDNYIRTLMALPDGKLLVGTNVGGLLRFDPATNNFTRLGTKSTGFGERIYGLSTDGKGGAWIATERGVHHLLPNSNTITNVWPAEGVVGRAFSVLQDETGALWIGSGDGLYVRRPGASRIERLTFAGEIGAALDQDIWALMRDSKGRLWVGSGTDGVVIIEGDKASQIAALKGSSAYIKHSTVRAISELPDGKIWIATDGSGVITLDPSLQNPVALRNNPERANSIASDTIRAVLKDDQGGVWAATELGANRTFSRTPKIFTISAGMPNPRRSLISNEVRGLLVTHDNHIWTGFSNGLIDVIDRKAGTVHHLRVTGRHQGQDVKALVEAPDGKILVGARGLVEFDPNTFRQTSINLPELEGKPIIALRFVGNSLLVGTYSGLFVWDRQKNKITHYIHKDHDHYSLVNNEVMNINVIGDQVWLSTSGGISRFNIKTGRFTNFFNVSGDPFSLPQNYSSSILTAAGKMWVGTYGGVAVASLNNPKPRFTAITEDDGLSGNDVSALLLDNNGKVWVASSNALSVIDARTKSVRTASKTDGVPVTTFNRFTAARLPDGSLMFGGSAGLTVVQSVIANEKQVSAAQLTPTTLEVNERLVPLGATISDQLPALSASTRSVRIGFSLLDYSAPREIRYSYKLEGFDKNWISVPAGMAATAAYTNLASGPYTLRLRAQVPGLSGVTLERKINFEIAAQWHEHWIVRGAIVALVMLAVFGLVQLRVRLLRRQANILEKQVQERTRALSDANTRLDQLARTDPLTGLLNRRHLTELLSIEHDRATRLGSEFAVILIDLDHFKSVNDKYGHHTGDTVLEATARIMQTEVRSIDSVARYGGEEFLILMPGASVEQAAAIAERVRTKIAEMPFFADEIMFNISVSCGVAAWERAESTVSLMRRADRALYAAKSAGRNSVRQSLSKSLAHNEF
ncbi:ligand-binding sensor domain-containing diguanylate cyclase [Altericroceibacterium indicum]|uniref:ligand-binding sensor domain-containing diguanylate cyclase n=1 Tax=Altericroceibacterium indicum TaxID=374177 RepID=UPI001368BF62|nr:ligand-binding sensor domain-containing diguanylate cyclase [Altericroceibacterium indicum]